jgi:hypothetical protein
MIFYGYDYQNSMISGAEIRSQKGYTELNFELGYDVIEGPE